MSDYITTYSGIHFYPLDPEKETISITDIAHALPLICRGNGQVHTFFSVGQHCINAALEAKLRGYSARVQLACLLHDASEAYLSDVPRPFKKYLDHYKEWEDRILDLVYIKFLGNPLTKEEEVLVKEIDNDLLYYDLKVLLDEPTPGPQPQLKIKLDYTEVPFRQVEERYLELFEKLSEELNSSLARI